MPNEFLSQDEVDALLEGAPAAEGEAGVGAESAAVRRYDLATQERIVQARMPTLDLINERFARLLRIGLFNFMRRHPEITVGPIRVSKYSDFTKNLDLPTNLNVVQLKPLRGSALFVLDPALVFLVIDNLFGGEGRSHLRAEGWEFSVTEQRIIQKTLEVIFADYEKAWKPVLPLKFEYLRSEMNTQYAQIANASEVVVVVTFRIEIGTAGGDFHVCIPYATLEPIRDLLYSTGEGPQNEPDKRWLHLLSKQVQAAEVELVATLAEVPVTCNQILNMKVGDVVMLDIKPTVEAAVEGVPVFRCRHGISQGQYALRIEEFIPSSKTD